MSGVRKFGNVQLRKDDKGKVVKAYARFKLNGKWMNAPQTFPDGETAQKWLDDEELSLKRGEWHPDNGADDTFESWAQRYVAKKKKNGEPKAPATVQGYNTTLDEHVLPVLGDTPIGQITVQTILQAQKIWGDKFDDEEPNRAWQKTEQMVNWVLQFAGRKGAVRLNPYDDEEVFVPNVKSHRDAVPLEVFEVEKLYETFHPHYATVILVAAYMGLRSGEIWALRHRHVNVLRKQLLVERSVAEIKGKGLVMGPTKNGKSRTLAIPPYVLEALEAHVKRNPGGPDEWLFRNQRRNQNRHTTFMNRFFYPAVEQAKLPERLIMHDLRHFCARFHMSQGYELATISKMLGHSSIQITYSIYGGIDDKALQAMAAATDKAIRSDKASRLSPITSLTPEESTG